MRLLVLSKYSRLGASSRLRMYQYIPYLESSGIQCIICPLFDDAYINHLFGRHQIIRIIGLYLHRIILLLRYYHIKFVWIGKELFPWIPYWFERIFIKGKTVVVDYDDAVFHTYNLHRSHFIRLILGKKIDRMMRDAALVITGNEYLRNHAAVVGATRIELLPTVVDTSRYNVKYQRKEPLIVGWIGSPSTTRYLYDLGAVILSFHSEKIKFVAIGAQEEKLSELPVENLSWTEENEVDKISEFDIGIMPLSDNPFEQGKCGYKLIQYMACGKPVIASPVGINCQIVTHGVNGFLASTVQEWIEAITSLAASYDLRVEMGRNGRRLVEQEYSLDSMSPRLKEMLLSL